MTEPNLCNLVLDLRSSINGSADPWDTAEVERVVALLKTKVADWDRTREDAIDRAVLSMVHQGIFLGQAELAERGVNAAP